MINLLFVAGQGQEDVQLAIDRERRQIKDAKDKAVHRDQLEFEELPAASMLTLITRLGESTPEILHFSGHGGEDGTYRLLDKEDYSQPISPEQLAEAFSAIGANYKVIVLSFCNSEKLAGALTNYSLATIYTTGEIEDRAAACFASVFYQLVASGNSIQKSFNIAKVAVKDNYEEDADLLQITAAPGVTLDEVVLTSAIKNKAKLELMWTSRVQGGFTDIVFGVRNVGDRLAKHPAIRFYESANFDFNKLRNISDYGANAFRVQHEGFNKAVLVEECNPQIVHPSAANFMAFYK